MSGLRKNAMRVYKQVLVQSLRQGVLCCVWVLNITSVAMETVGLYLSVEKHFLSVSCSLRGRQKSAYPKCHGFPIESIKTKHLNIQISRDVPLAQFALLPPILTNLRKLSRRGKSQPL